MKAAPLTLLGLLLALALPAIAGAQAPPPPNEEGWHRWPVMIEIGGWQESTFVVDSAGDFCGATLRIKGDGRETTSFFSGKHDVRRGFLYKREGSADTARLVLDPHEGLPWLTLPADARTKRRSDTTEWIEGTPSCHGDGETAFVVASEQGDGVVVALGGAAALTNDLLDEEANAELAAALLAPVEGARVVVLEAPRVGGGDEGLVGLVPVRVDQALAQLAAAFLLYALLRARRLGGPVAEPQPVQVAGSELVAASGRLRERAGHREATAERLRAEAVRGLTERLGVPPSTPPEQVADLVAARSPALAGQADAVRALLVAPPPADDAALVDLAARLEALRRAAGR